MRFTFSDRVTVDLLSIIGFALRENCWVFEKRNEVKTRSGRDNGGAAGRPPAIPQFELDRHIRDFCRRPGASIKNVTLNCFGESSGSRYGGFGRDCSVGRNRKLFAQNRRFQPRAAEKSYSKSAARKKESLRNSFFNAPAQAIAVYELARVAAQSAEKPGVGVHIWKETRGRFSSLLKDWEDIEKLGDPIIDFLVTHYCQIVRELVAAAEAEYRAYKETAFLLRSPRNAKRLEEALKEARSALLTLKRQLR